MNTLTLNELGVGRYTRTSWAVTFPGAVTLYFDDEPEHRALETLMLIAEADNYVVTPPTRVTEAG